ncbi:MAG: 2Fe-2S iron-sulfur cluster binding domain-containing protein [SAR324 cluster bacterium]|nr:2Fe-2S iron-sulfur cluster binding domain-containing protein [SAR324 cluster bacterium]
MQLFSKKKRPVHLGPYPLERLPRRSDMPDLNDIPMMEPIHFQNDKNPDCLSNSMASFITMLDAIRDGAIASKPSEIPSDPGERSRHLKAAGYFFDASQVGICRLPKEALLENPIRNPRLDQLVKDMETAQPKTLASGIDVVVADVKEAARAKSSSMDHHHYAVVFLIEHPRDPDPNEPGSEWIVGTEEHRSAVRAAEAAVILSNYLRIMGFEARGHTVSSSDVNLNVLAVAAGLVEKSIRKGAEKSPNPYVGTRYALAAITTPLELAPDAPLAAQNILSRWHSHGPSWYLGKYSQKNAFNYVPYQNRSFYKGAIPFENIQTRQNPTTFIDEERVARVPKRTDMFARALFGDMGKNMQEAAKNGHYIAKNPMGYCSRRVIAALILLQDGKIAPKISPNAKNPNRNAANVKASLYYFGADAVGLSPCPDWTYYSHDAAGNPLKPYHKNAISILIDQGQETMDGCSGDDWISGAQSMRAYLRTSLIGGIVAEQIRRLGYSARVHSVLDGEVLQPPLLLLSGLGEVSRIGEVILNPYLGPRLKSGVVTTDMPFAYDKPIDFGLQNFCRNCSKCARECPAGAITAGSKVMFNGYEIYKSDSERCTRYRLTNLAGSMCGRCMKTCPWNLEGLFREAPFRWLAMKLPQAARWLAKLDDKVNNGDVNPVKKWWWDIVLEPDGKYVRAGQSNARHLNLDLDLKHEDQTLAVYPAPLVPPPYPFPFVMDREKGIAAYRALLTPEQHKERLALGKVDQLVPQLELPKGPAPVIPVKVSKVVRETAELCQYEFVSLDGNPLPKFEAGAHIDVLVAPEYFRQYSLAGDPADQSKYVIAVLREDQGRGGSKLMHRIFQEGRKVFISRPINHFPLFEDAFRSFFFAGGIGVTPMMAMAHRLHSLGKEFHFYYSAKSRKKAGFLADLDRVPWKKQVQLFFSDENKRADLNALLQNFKPGDHLYTCGPNRYMDAVLETAEKNGWPEESCSREYFSVPEAGDYVNYDFSIRLAKSGKTFKVPADKSATEVLAENGIHVDIKCSEGICGVCALDYLEGEVEHRDFVLAKSERDHKIIICCSRAKKQSGEIIVDL